ncbi:MFS transporter [Mesorhizobium sp. L-8-3]|uniref:MFS transporter n=1 Tax=Mesorhizobium sp. L-8-3 TaxID=2744522 RepID=UPI0019280269|nr:MFS transporter [Mesorhizobium sp. L-8-3]BCH24387.1 MFS transporter [Mesorhizobium sp. L-8-3]
MGVAEKTPWPALTGVIATVSVFAIAQGLSYPLLSFILERQGASSSLIGLSAAMTPLGFIVSAPVIPSLVRRFGAARTALVCAFLGATLLALIGWTRDVWLWFPLRFLLGFSINPLYVISETWMLMLAPPSSRGRIMGAYTAVVSAGFATGPLILSIAGTQGWTPFLVGIAAFGLCTFCLGAVLPRLPEFHDADGDASLARFIPLAALLLLAVTVAAAFEQSLLSLTSVYARSYGNTEAATATLLAVFVAGNIALQVPLGMVAERLGPAKGLALCAAGSALGCLLLPFLFATPLIWPLAFVLGAISFGIYTMALIELANRFSGPMLIAGNAAFALFWGVGGIAGPPVTGAVMDIVGTQGLPLALGSLCFVLALLQTGRRSAWGR